MVGIKIFMNNTSFIKTIKREIERKKSHLCIGLDTDYQKIPKKFKTKRISSSIFNFNKQIIDSTNDLVVAYKINLVFYSAYGLEGLKALKKTTQYIKQKYPQIKLIAECKRTEIGWCAKMAIRELFDELLFDASNIMPWYGEDSVAEYRNLKGKALFVICHDTNCSSGEIQDIRLKNSQKMYEYITGLVANKWNITGNILIEAALTYPKTLKNIARIGGGNQFYLIVGLGSQGGKISDLKVFKKNKNFIVSSSRSVIYAKFPREQAEKYRQEIEAAIC